MHTLAWLCVSCCVYEASCASLRSGHAKALSASTGPADEETIASNGTAQLEDALSAILSGRSPQGEYERLAKEGRAEAEMRGASLAAARLGVSGTASIDLADIAAAWAVQSSTQHGDRSFASAPLDEATIAKAVKSVNAIMAKASQQLDERAMACKEMRDKAEQMKNQLELDLASASNELAAVTGLRTASVTQLQGVEVTIAKLDADWKEDLRVLNNTMLSLDRARKLQQDDVAKLRRTVALTKCPASFLARGAKAASSQGLWSCRNKTTGAASLHFSGSKAWTEAFEAPAAQQLLHSLLEVGRVTSSNSTQREAVPNELQSLKCSYGRLTCGTLHLGAMRLLAETTDSLDELEEQEVKADKEHKISRKRLGDKLEALRALKMTLQEQLAKAVSRMGTANDWRRSVSQEVRTHKRERRARQEQCKMDAGKIFETLCSLRRIRRFLASKSKVISEDVIVDCDVTEWQPGECSKRCDDACPGRTCGGQLTVARDVIQAAGAFGMACPSLSKIAACNQVKCPVPCKTSGWSNWTTCSRECAGGFSSRTRTITQSAKHGGEGCGPLTESRSCNTGACGICAMRPWSNWSTCSAICGGGLQVKSRAPVEDSEDAPSSGAAEPSRSAYKEPGCKSCSQAPPITFLETAKARCPSATSPHRYQERACMTQKCNGNETCAETQDVIFAIDGSASLSEGGFKALRSFAAALAAKYTSASRFGVVEFGNGELSAIGTISDAVKVTDLGADTSSAANALKNLKLFNGFPNMAQALGLAEDMFGKARAGAQKSLVVITNSKPMYRHKTFAKAERLRRLGVRIFVVAASDYLEAGPLWDKASDIDMIKGIASRPVAANYFHIDGLIGRKADPLSHVAAVLAKSCQAERGKGDD